MSDSSELIARMQRVEAFGDARICCLGDVMLDRFVYGDVSRISPEAPIPVMKRTHEQTMLGGAGNVARNITSLGAHCTFLTVIGEDVTGSHIEALLDEQSTVLAHLVREKGRKTSEKARFVGAGQQLLRCDDEDVRPITAQSETQLLAQLEAILPTVSLLIVSDYAKGVLTQRVLREAITLAKTHKVPVFIDPKRADIAVYAGADLISPNAKEMAAFAGDEDPLEAAQTFSAQHNIGCFAITRGQDGLSLVRPNAEILHLPAQRREVFDVSGAGDTVMATLAVATAAGAPPEEAAHLANIAAGIAVSRAGTATVYRTDLKAALHNANANSTASKLVSTDMAEAIISHWREDGGKVGFTNGCFDLLHVGHLQSLSVAKSYCSKLVVAINSDASVKRLKGESRPLNNEIDRANLLAGLGCVDLVVIFREDTPEAMLHRLRPDVLMKGEDYTEDQVVGGEFVRSYGGEVKLLPLKEGHSSSALIEKSKAAS